MYLILCTRTYCIVLCSTQIHNYMLRICNRRLHQLLKCKILNVIMHLCSYCTDISCRYSTVASAPPTPSRIYVKGTNPIRHYAANKGHCNDDLGSTSDYTMHGKEEGRVILLSIKIGSTPSLLVSLLPHGEKKDYEMTGTDGGIKPILTTAKECGLL
jgi:hypothetical protein